MILPIFFTLIASGIHKYPFKGRLLLFIVPSIIIIIAEGVEQIVAKTQHNAPFIGIAFICLLLLNPTLSAGKYLVKPRTNEEIKPVLYYVSKHEQSDDVVYIYYNAAFAYKYYSKIFNIIKKQPIIGMSPKQKWENYVTDLQRLRGNRRVWVLFSHVNRWKGVDEEKLFLYYLNSMGKKLDSFKSAGASVYLFDFFH